MLKVIRVWIFLFGVLVLFIGFAEISVSGENLAQIGIVNKGGSFGIFKSFFAILYGLALVCSPILSKKNLIVLYFLKIVLVLGLLISGLFVSKIFLGSPGANLSMVERVLQLLVAVFCGAPSFLAIWLFISKENKNEQN
jgi:hypothetical protein